jgi:hypothetical protein
MADGGGSEVENEGLDDVEYDQVQRTEHGSVRKFV